MMRALLLRIAFALFIAGEAGAQTDVRVLNYNIHRDIGSSSSNFSSQPSLAEVVNYLDPDVWTINELGGNNGGFNSGTAHDFLSSFIAQSLTIFGLNPVENVNFFIYVGTITDGFESNAIVSRYPILARQTFSDAGGGFTALRGLTMALIDLPGATDLGLFTAHLKALSSDASAARRQAEAEADRTTIANWMTSHPDAATILAGDFNETEEPGEAANWSGHQIGDPLPSGAIYHPITTLRSANLSQLDPVSITNDRDTISASNPNARFDYVMFDAAHLRPLSSEIFDIGRYSAAQRAALNSANGTSFDGSESVGASDHLPVFATFQVVPEPGAFALFVIAAGLSLVVRSLRQKDAGLLPNRS